MVTTIDLAAGFTVTNETDKRGQALLALIATNIPGFRTRYYGFRPFGQQDTIAFPAVMVECNSQAPGMPTTGKYLCVWQYSIYFYVTEDNPNAVVTLQSSAAEAIIELFSNAHFKANSGYWTNSEMKGVLLSTSFENARPARQRYMRVGVVRLELQDFLIK